MGIRGERSIEVEIPVGTADDRMTPSDIGPTAPGVGGVATGAETTPDDPASGVLTGYPGTRIGHTERGGQGPEDPAAGILTGYSGKRTADHVHAGTHGLDDPAAGVLTGYPGARAPHSETGGQAANDPAAGILTGYPGYRTAVGPKGYRTAAGPEPRSTGSTATGGDAETRP